MVLRGHEADYFTKGTRRVERPTYLSLQGAVIVLDANDAECQLDLIDPAGFERDAMNKDRQDVAKDKGVSF